MTKRTLHKQISELQSERDELIDFVRAVLPELRNSTPAIAGLALAIELRLRPTRNHRPSCTEDTGMTIVNFNRKGM